MRLCPPALRWPPTARAVRDSAASRQHKGKRGKSSQRGVQGSGSGSGTLDRAEPSAYFCECAKYRALHPLPGQNEHTTDKSPLHLMKTPPRTAIGRSFVRSCRRLLQAEHGENSRGARLVALAVDQPLGRGGPCILRRRHRRGLRHRRQPLVPAGLAPQTLESRCCRGREGGDGARGARGARGCRGARGSEVASIGERIGHVRMGGWVAVCCSVSPALGRTGRGSARGGSPARRAAVRAWAGRCRARE